MTGTPNTKGARLPRALTADIVTACSNQRLCCLHQAMQVGEHLLQQLLRSRPASALGVGVQQQLGVQMFIELDRFAAGIPRFPCSVCRGATCAEAHKAPKATDHNRMRVSLRGPSPAGEREKVKS